MNEIIRCKECKKPITEDNIKHTFSLCYECYKEFISNKMRKGSGLKCFGIIALLIVSSMILIDSTFYRFEDPINTTIFILVSIGILIIPSIFIYYGIKKERKWK